MQNYLSCRSTSIRALLVLVLFTADGFLALKAASFGPEAKTQLPKERSPLPIVWPTSAQWKKFTGSTGSGRRKIQGPNHRWMK